MSQVVPEAEGVGMSSKPEQTRRARHCSHRVRHDAKRELRRLRRRLEKLMLDDTPKRLTRGWAD